MKDGRKVGSHLNQLASADRPATIGNRELRKLRIGMFIQHFPPRLGGAEYQAKMLVTELAARGHRVELVTTRHQAGLPHSEKSGALSIRRLPTVSPRWLKLPVNLVFGLIAGLQVARRSDIVHAHCLSPFALGALLAAKLLRRPVLIKICSIGTEGDIARIRGFGPGGILWPCYRQADLFIAQTRSVASELFREGARRNQVAVVPNLLEDQGEPGGPLQRANQRRELGLANKLTLAFVGRLHPGKGLHCLMQVWPEIARRYDAQLLLVGEGPLGGEIAKWRAAGDLSGSVVMAGYQPHTAPYYRASDILVFPSQSESFGNAIVEAMGHGLAVATTRVGVVCDWSDDAPVSVIDNQRPDELTAKLCELIENEAMRRDLGNRAAGFIRGRYGVNTVCEQYLREYRRLIPDSVSEHAE